MVRIPAGSHLTGDPFNIPVGAVFDLSAQGSFTVDWAAEAGGVAQVTGFSAMYSELHPVLGPYDIFATGSGPGSTFSGELTNIVSDNGDLFSADMTLSTTFSLVFNGTGIEGTTLYTQDASTFVGTISANGTGTGFSAPEDLNVFLSTGDVNNDPLSAISFNRTVTAVPEPSCGLLVSLLGIAVLHRKRI